MLSTSVAAAEAPLLQSFPMLEGRAAQAWRHQPAFRRPRHFHPEPELNLVLRGHALIRVGELRIEAGPGALLCFQPGQDHELEYASDDLDLFVLALRPELAAKISSWPSAHAIQPVKLSTQETNQLGNRLAASSELRDRNAVEGLIADVFERMGPRLRQAHVVSRRAMGELTRDPSASERELALLARSNPSQVSRLFKRDLGLRLVEYRARQRLMHFIDGVDAGQSFTQAALEAHFGSYAQCHRVFQRIMRCAPRDYFAGARTHVDARLALDALK
ncbi:MAG TPA: AraC family ligand binding domain-containing protein [Polyangiaceae bacterium]|nr:AraC family ligand binding domain-containing protein [Polyangiaceae bacterium]